jgi:hypothetical protein
LRSHSGEAYSEPLDRLSEFLLAPGGIGLLTTKGPPPRGLHRGLHHMLIRDASGTSDPRIQAKSL